MNTASDPTNYTQRKAGTRLTAILVVLLLAAVVAAVWYLRSLQSGPAASRQDAPTGMAQAERAGEQQDVLAAETTEPAGDLRKVIQVVDGDTLKVDIAGKVETLRLIGVDTPEVVDPRTTIQCYGKEASDFSKATLTGKSVRLESDASQDTRDKYGRLLMYVFLEDGTNFNGMLIAQGYAFEYTYNDPYKYQSEFMAAQSAAETSKQGLWSAETCGGAKKPATAPMPQSSQAPAAVPPTGNCDANYTPCVPQVNYDLDCSDLKFKVTIIGSDPHKLDGGGDGTGCEAYP